MLTKLLRKLQACVAEDADFLVEHRAGERLYATNTVDEEHGHTAIGAIIALRNAVEGVGECLAEREVLVELIARSDNSIEVGHLHTVLVNGATIVEQSRGVTQRQVLIEVGKEVVGLIERGRKLACYDTVGVRIQERRLDERKQRG